MTPKRAEINVKGSALTKLEHLQEYFYKIKYKKSDTTKYGLKSISLCFSYG